MRILLYAAFAALLASGVALEVRDLMGLASTALATATEGSQ